MWSAAAAKCQDHNWKKEISRHRPPLSSISVATTLFAWKMRPLIGSLRTPRTSFATYITIAEYAVTNNQYERTKANWYGGTTVARACYVVFACENCWTAGVRHDSLTVSISASHCGPAARCRKRFGTYQKHTFRYSGCTQLNAIIFSWLICVLRNIAYTRQPFSRRAFLFLWPWRWPVDLNIQTWPELARSRLSKVGALQPDRWEWTH